MSHTLSEPLSDKPTIRDLVEICAAKGLHHVILSPGSRNAPFTISFNEHGGFRCLSIPDERCAAFVALGLAQQTGMPAIICCTSGSAALNYFPAISEAYYQKVPMLIVTADRPEEWLGQGEGQSVQQRDVYGQHVEASYQLHLDKGDPDLLWSNARKVNEAINCCISRKAPVHINVPLREPLYGTRDYTGVPLPRILDWIAPKKTAVGLDENTFCGKKVLVVCGLLPQHERLNPLLERIAQYVPVLAEHSANVQGGGVFHQLDMLLHHIPAAYSPEYLLSIGHSFVSKKLKQWLRANPPREHWHISEHGEAQDVFQALSRHYPLSPEVFLGAAEPAFRFADRSYLPLWQKRKRSIQIMADDFLAECPWSDLAAFRIILGNLPEGAQVQLANSSPIRYAQFFPMREDLRYFSNRGVSGIDGCTSTAVGAALAQAHQTAILITGDVAFFYDSNALWHQHLPSNLRIILINNQGGGIFRLIPGPASTQQLADFFEAHHSFRAEGLCGTFGIPYYFAAQTEELEDILPRFFAPQAEGKPAVLEVMTPREENDRVFRAFYHKITPS